MDEKKKILVVDDDSLILRSIKRMLDEEYTVYISISGEQAYSFLEKRNPDIILLDYEMPGWDGKKTYETIRQHELGKGIPIFFMTGLSADKLGPVREIGAQGIISKPIDEDALRETLSRL